jgi:GxxExxY protein
MQTEAPRLPIGDPLSDLVVECAKQVYRRLGPGFSKTTYEEALCYELTLKRLPYQRHVTIPLFYRGARLSASSVADLVVSGAVLVDVRATEALLLAHRVELKFRLRRTGIDTGLVVNFGAPKFSEAAVLIRRRSVADAPRGDAMSAPLPAEHERDYAVAS